MLWVHCRRWWNFFCSISLGPLLIMHIFKMCPFFWTDVVPYLALHRVSCAVYSYTTTHIHTCMHGPEHESELYARVSRSSEIQNCWVFPALFLAGTTHQPISPPPLILVISLDRVFVIKSRDLESGSLSLMLAVFLRSCVILNRLSNLSSPPNMEMMIASISRILIKC